MSASLRSIDGSVEWSVSGGRFDANALLRSELRVVVSGESWPVHSIVLDARHRWLMLVAFEEVPLDVELGSSDPHPVKDGWDAPDGSFVLEIRVEPGCDVATVRLTQRSRDDAERRIEGDFAVRELERFYGSLRRELRWPERAGNYS